MLWKKKPKKPLPKKVLIVGAGTTGLTSAFELARRGIVPQVIDAKNEIAPTARATGVSVRSLELLEDSGVTPLLIAAGIKVKYAKITGEECKGLKLDFNDLPHKYNFLLCLPQNRTEAVMQKRFEELGGNVQYRTKLISLTKKKDGTIDAVMERDGKRLTETFNAVIGADGVNSRVRQDMGVKLTEHVYPDKWSAAEFDSKDWPRSGDEIQYFLGKGGSFAVVVPLGGDRYRAVANTPDAMSCISVKHTVDKLHFNNAFAVSVRHVDTYQKGNIFLAGDAAHAYPPAGVQGGMNLGIKDACSLARRIAEDDTKGYTKERRKEAEATISQARMMVSIAGMKNAFMKSARNRTVAIATHIKAIKKQILKKSLGA
ncbi:MAG: FAD-dependent monooxygenase [Alphaproteobacteria bacterium]|nr:MAG: FAD-dependent monooxygenase [Alphaproteobacteria bacterium]